MEIISMAKNFAKIPVICLIILVVFAGSALGQMLYPYKPTNAVAAEPSTPYNLDQIPVMSYQFYWPCPTCGLYAEQLPDLPPVWMPFPGPFGMRVPVP